MASEELTLGVPAGSIRHRFWEHETFQYFLAEYFMIYINGFLVFFITKLST